MDRQKIEYKVINIINNISTFEVVDITDNLNDDLYLTTDEFEDIISQINHVFIIDIKAGNYPNWEHLIVYDLIQLVERKLK